MIYVVEQVCVKQEMKNRHWQECSSDSNVVTQAEPNFFWRQFEDLLSQHYVDIPDKGGEENPKEGRENDEEHEKNSNDKELLTNVKMRERKLNINMSKIMLY